MPAIFIYFSSKRLIETEALNLVRYPTPSKRSQKINIHYQVLAKLNNCHLVSDKHVYPGHCIETNMKNGINYNLYSINFPKLVSGAENYIKHLTFIRNVFCNTTTIILNTSAVYFLHYTFYT